MQNKSGHRQSKLLIELSKALKKAVLVINSRHLRMITGLHIGHRYLDLALSGIVEDPICSPEISRAVKIGRKYYILQLGILKVLSLGAS